METIDMALIAVVIPWFGEHCRGGAERLAGLLHDLLTEIGHDVEILTTTSKSFDSDWAVSFYDSGSLVEDGRHIRRFEVSSRNKRAFDHVNGKLLNGERPTACDEHIFLHESINSLSLNREIARGYYDLYFYLPYLYGPTMFGLLHNRPKNVLLPLLHDEAYARLSVVARSVTLPRAAAFLSSQEQTLFHEIYARSLPTEIVAPVPIRLASGGDSAGSGVVPQPYILYAGRKDDGKNLQFLFETLEKLSSDAIKLVLIGGGGVEGPRSLSSRIVDLGYVDEATKSSLMKDALCLMQPSRLESFSIVVAEASSHGTPVIVQRACSVLREYVQVSHGGVAVDSAQEAAAQVQQWANDPGTAREVGSRGQRFAENEFAWGAVRDKYIALLNQLIGAQQA